MGRCKSHIPTHCMKLHNADSSHFRPIDNRKSAISFNWRDFRVDTGRSCLNRCFFVVCSVWERRRGRVRRMRHSRTRASDHAETGSMAVRVLPMCVIAWCISGYRLEECLSIKMRIRLEWYTSSVKFAKQCQLGTVNEYCIWSHERQHTVCAVVGCIQNP